MWATQPVQRTPVKELRTTSPLNRCLISTAHTTDETVASWGPVSRARGRTHQCDTAGQAIPVGASISRIAASGVKVVERGWAQVPAPCRLGPAQQDSPAVEEAEFETRIASELAALPGVLAVTLGGSRARGDHRPDSDWDFAIYYRGFFEPDSLRIKGWPGQVFDVGAWGGGVMNGGAWLTIDGLRVDVHYRDLENVEYWTKEAQQGRFRKEFLLFYAAGIPTYIVMAELALNRVLHGSVTVPEYPDALSRQAGARWHDDLSSTPCVVRKLRTATPTERRREATCGR